METKSPLQSKTLWINLIMALAAMFYPPAASYISAHPEMVVSVFAVVNIVLRLISSNKISLE